VNAYPFSLERFLDIVSYAQLCESHARVRGLTGAAQGMRLNDLIRLLLVHRDHCPVAAVVVGDDLAHVLAVGHPLQLLAQPGRPRRGADKLEESSTPRQPQTTSAQWRSAASKASTRLAAAARGHVRSGGSSRTARTGAR
jgi:hypothetical protein